MLTSYTSSEEENIPYLRKFTQTMKSRLFSKCVGIPLSYLLYALLQLAHKKQQKNPNIDQIMKKRKIGEINLR